MMQAHEIVEETKPIKLEFNSKVQYRVSTWKRDSHGLFDFESDKTTELFAAT